METGESSISPGARRPPTRPRPPAVTTGTVEVTVNLEAICWDTFASEGSTDSSDRPLAEALVALFPASGAMLTQTTGADGKVRFENVPLGAARLRSARTDYINAEDTVTVAAGTTATVTLTMRNANAECDRKHTPPPAGVPGSNWLGPLFWTDEPWILLIRDVVWLLFTVASVAFLALGLYPPAGVLLALGGICFAIASYATHVIFGMIAGVITMVLAALAFTAITVFTVMALVMSAPPIPVADAATGAFGMPGPNLYFFPALCAIWLAFVAGMLPGRQAFSNKDWAVVIVAVILGALTAFFVYLAMYLTVDPVGAAASPGTLVWQGLLQLIAGAAMGFLGGLMGHIFVNDGNLDAPSWGLQDLELPYAGERYCVQGHRGWISHFFRLNHGTNRAGAAVTWTTDEEFSYDWALPLNEPILAAREGHVVAFKEDRDGNGLSTPKNETANYVYVRHKDGSEAHYLHIVLGGFTATNPTLAALGVAVGAGTTDAFFELAGNPNAAPATPPPTPPPAMPVHVHAGQRLAPAGNVGYSMFSHLHFAVRRKTPIAGRGFMPIKFKDADVASHEGRCFSMRKYRSSNVDRGPCSLT